MKTVNALQYDTVDEICWREYGYTAGIVEKVLEENPKIINFGVVLPMGTEVILPNVETSQKIKQTIQLWD